MPIPEAIQDLLESRKNFLATGAATEEQVRDLEAQLRVSIPDQYRDFLLRFGSVLWFGHAIFGIGSGPFGPTCDLAAVRATLRARAREVPPGFTPVPQQAVVVERYGGGGFFCLDCSSGAGSDKVLLAEDDRMGAIVQVWPDFHSWVKWLAG